MTPQREPKLHPLDQYFSTTHRNLRRIVRKALTRPVIASVVSATVTGQDHVRDVSGAFIVVGNHSSHLDAPMLFSMLPDHVTERLAAGAAADYFYRRRLIARLTALFFNTYPIERPGKMKKPPEFMSHPSHGSKAITGDIQGPARGMTGRLLRAGIPILIFPEGTRSRDGVMAKFKPGAAALSAKLDVPIVPVAMIGNHEAMPVGAIWPKPGRLPVTVVIGGPLKCHPGESVEAFNERIYARVVAMKATGVPISNDSSDEFRNGAA